MSTLGGPTETSVAPNGRRHDQPILALLTSHWVSLLGLGLIVTALITWLFVLPLQGRGHVDNPHIGILAFLIVPLIFFAALALVPIRSDVERMAGRSADQAVAYLSKFFAKQGWISADKVQRANRAD